MRGIWHGCHKNQSLCPCHCRAALRPCQVHARAHKRSALREEAHSARRSRVAAVSTVNGGVRVRRAKGQGDTKLRIEPLPQCPHIWIFDPPVEEKIWETPCEHDFCAKASSCDSGQRRRAPVRDSKLRDEITRVRMAKQRGESAQVANFHHRAQKTHASETREMAAGKFQGEYNLGACTGKKNYLKASPVCP